MGVVIEKSIEIEKIPSLRILVADDDELGRRLMRVILTHEGHYVEVAANGRRGQSGHGALQRVYQDV